MAFGQERFPALADIGDQEGQLAELAGRFVVHVDHVGDLVEGEPEPLATRDELEPYPIPSVEDPSRALPFGREEPAVLIEPDGPQGGVELPCELPNGPGSFTHQARAPSDRSLDMTFT